MIFLPFQPLPHHPPLKLRRFALLYKAWSRHMVTACGRCTTKGTITQTWSLMEQALACLRVMARGDGTYQLIVYIDKTFYIDKM